MENNETSTPDLLSKYSEALVDPGPKKPASATATPTTPAPKAPGMEDYIKAMDSTDPISSVLTGTIGEKDPNDYNFQMKPGLDNDLLRAQDQGTMIQIGLGLANAVPNIATGIAKTVGQLGTILQFGDDRTYDNALIQTMDKWHNPFGEIYQEHPNETFDIKDPAWWIKQGMGLVEMTGQFAAVGAGLGGILARGAAGLGELLGGSAGITKALLGGAQVATSAALSYTIGASMGASVFQQAYATNYAKLLSQGANRDKAHTQAQHIAAQAAATTVQLNTALGFGLNLTSVLPVFKQSDDVLGFFQKEGQGARADGESLAAYKARLQGYGASDSAVNEAIGDTSGLGHRLQEGLKQSAEGMLMHFSEKAGERVGASGKTKGFFEQFDELGNLLTDATSQQGVLNAILGVAGGVLNTVALEKIPLHSDYVRQNGEPVPIIHPDGTPKVDEEGQPIFQTKLYSSRKMASNQRMAYFENTRDAIVADIDHISAKTEELQALAKAGKSEELQPVLNELLAVQQLHSIALGTADNLIAQYQDMAATDNNKDLGEAAREQAEQVTQQQHDFLLQNGVDKPEDLPEEAKGQFDQLEQQRKQLLDDSVKLAGTSDAMQKGYTDSMKNNDYKLRATEASEDIIKYQGWHKELSRTFGGDPRYLEARVPEIVLHKQIQGYLYNRLISKLDGENAQERALIEAQQGPVLTADNFNSIIRDYNRKVVKNQSLGTKFNDELARLHDIMKRGSIPELGAMLAKYKVDYAQGDIIPAARELSRKLAEIRDTKLNLAKEAYANIAESLEFKNWKEQNPGKDLADYLTELQKRTIHNEALSSKEEYTDQLREEAGILQDQLNRIKAKPREYAKSVLKDFEKAQKRLTDRIKEENSTFIDKDREKVAVENLSNDQQRQANKVYQAKIADLETEIAKRETELKDATGTETTKLGRLVSWVKDPRENKLRKELANLQAQADFFRDKLASVLMPDNTTEEIISENELTALPGDVADSITDLSGQLNSQLSPEQIRQQLSKMLANKGIDIATITPDSIDAAVVRALTANKEGNQKDTREVVDKLDTLIAGTGNPELIREAIDEILNDPSKFSYDALALHQMMGFVDQPTAAKIMQATNDIINGSNVAEDTKTTTSDTPVETPEPDDEETPVTGDVNEPEPPEPPTPTPDDTSDQVVLGRNTNKNGRPMFHLGAKAIDAIKINRLDINYTTDINETEGEYKLKSISSDINRTLSEAMLEHGKVVPGTKLRLVVDREWKGTKAVDSLVDTKTGDEIGLYMDKDGKIPNAQNLIDDVPIKIVNEAGETLGYLPRVGWVLAKNEGATNYRNIAPTESDPNNPETQAARLRAVRAHVVKFFNSGSKDIETVVSARDSAHLIMSVDKDGNLEPKSASKMLPASDLELGVVDYGNIKTGKTTNSAKTLSIATTDQDWMVQNAPVALVPMPDGKHSIAPLFNRSIEQYEIKTMLEATRAYLTGDANTISKIKELTGFDVSRADGLRNFINQHYTYTNRFSLASLQPSMDANAVPKFLFNITNESGNQKAEISLGTSYSGRDRIMATLQGTQLHPEFVRQFTEGMKGRYKNVVFDDPQRGLKGLNSGGKINEVVFSNGAIKVRKEHASYNDYVKSFSDTPVNGTNQLSSGERVYGVHANTTMDMESIISTRPNKRVAARIPDASIDVTPEAKPKSKGSKFSAEDASLLDTGFMDQMPAFDTPEVTLDNLRELHTFTPIEERNEKTPQEVMAELKQIGLEHLPPDFNPFTKC